MRTHVVIDDDLMEQALALTGLSTKKAVIDEALRTLVQMRSQEEIRSLRGQLHWEGDLNAMREERVEYNVKSSGNKIEDTIKPEESATQR